MNEASTINTTPGRRDDAGWRPAAHDAVASLCQSVDQMRGAGVILAAYMDAEAREEDKPLLMALERLLEAVRADLLATMTSLDAAAVAA